MQGISFYVLMCLAMLAAILCQISCFCMLQSGSADECAAFITFFSLWFRRSASLCFPRRTASWRGMRAWICTRNVSVHVCLDCVLVYIYGCSVFHESELLVNDMFYGQTGPDANRPRGGATLGTSIAGLPASHTSYKYSFIIIIMCVCWYAPSAL